eukprot:5807593-Pleurochrysis_carterae.AAC.1
MQLLSASDSSSSSMSDAVSTCIASTSVNAMAAARALRRVLMANHVAAEGMPPPLVEGLDRQQKLMKNVAVLAGLLLKFFLRFGSKMRGVGDNREGLQPGLIHAVLAE